MPLPKFAARRDANESEIIEALTRAGASVVQLSVKDVCDLLVGFEGVNYLLEVKTEKGSLSDGQFAFFESWDGQCAVVRSVEDALKVIGR